MNNMRPKSENPLELVESGLGVVASDGYRWVSGKRGSHRIADRFLTPRSELGRVAAISDDAYTRLVETAISESALVDFANDYGYLGIVREHFHSEEGVVGYSESFSGWVLAIQEFQSCFKTWELLSNGSAGAPRQRVESLNWHGGKDVRATARGILVQKINRKLSPGIVHYRPSEKPCYLDGCQWTTPRAKTTAHVSYALEFDRKRDSIQGRVFPDCLLAAIWLQFAELVCGNRRLRRCEICMNWMDISEAARPAAKKMHERCSRAERMRRYRKAHG